MRCFEIYRNLQQPVDSILFILNLPFVTPGANDMEDRTFRILAKQIRALNRHLAIEKRSLRELLREEKPAIRLRDGELHRFKRAELEKLAKLVPEHLHGALRLPIYIELSSDRFGKGTARIAGRAECIAVAKILEKSCEGEELFIYKPEIRILRRELPTTTQYMFTTALD